MFFLFIPHMLEIFSKFADYKRIQNFKPPHYSTQQIALQKQFIKKNANTVLTLLLQIIKNETDTNFYLNLYVEYALNNDIDLEILKAGLEYFKIFSVATYDSIRILIKLHEYDDEFIIQYVDNNFLAIIAGEYIRKYEKPFGFLLNFERYIVAVFISYVCVGNYDLIDDFEEMFIKAFHFFRRDDFEEVCVILMKHLTCSKSIVMFQSSVKTLMESVRNKREYLNDFFMELVPQFLVFFKKNDFVDELFKILEIQNIDIFNKLLKIQSIEKYLYCIINNSEPQVIHNFLVTTSKKYFLFFYEKLELIGVKENLLTEILIIWYFYNPDYIFKIKRSVSDIKINFLLDKEKLKFSLDFVNGLSFIDKMCQIREEDIKLFLQRIEGFNENMHNEYEKIFFKIEFKYFTQYLKKNNLTSLYQNVLKRVCIENSDLRIHILNDLVELDDIYKYYIEIENIARNRIKEIKIKMEYLFNKVEDQVFYFDYMFKRTEILAQMDNFVGNRFFIEKIKNMQEGENKKYLCRIYKIDYEESSISNGSNIKKIRLTENSQEENHEKINMHEVNQNNKLNKLGAFTIDENKKHILFYLDNKLILPKEYVLSEEDKTMKFRIKEKISAIMIKIIIDERKRVDGTKDVIQNISSILNLFADTDLLNNLLNDVLKFFKNNNLKSCFNTIGSIINNLNYNIYPAKDIIMKYIEKSNHKILVLFADKIMFDDCLDFYSNFDEISYKQVFTKILKQKIIESEISRNNYIKKLLKHKIFRLEGLKLSRIYLLKDDDCMLIAEKIVESCEELYLLEALEYLKESNHSFNNDILYELLFKRAKLDTISCFILSIIQIKEEHIERLLELFYLNPIKYIEFLPQIIKHGGKITDDIIKELLFIIKNIYDDEVRKQIKKIIEGTVFEDSYDICQFILTDLEGVNVISKIFLLELLSRIYVNCVQNFVGLVRNVGNEKNLKCLILMLDILKKNKAKYYSKIQEWKSKDVLIKTMFRIYPLDYVDKEFYKKICQKYRHHEEYDLILKYYKNELN